MHEAIFAEVGLGTRLGSPFPFAPRAFKWDGLASPTRLRETSIWCSGVHEATLSPPRRIWHAYIPIRKASLSNEQERCCGPPFVLHITP